LYVSDSGTPHRNFNFDFLRQFLPAAVLTEPERPALLRSLSDLTLGFDSRGNLKGLLAHPKIRRTWFYANWQWQWFWWLIDVWRVLLIIFMVSLCRLHHMAWMC
jgi:hypothetical protein